MQSKADDIIVKNENLEKTSRADSNDGSINSEKKWELIQNASIIYIW